MPLPGGVSRTCLRQAACSVAGHLALRRATSVTAHRLQLFNQAQEARNVYRDDRWARLKEQPSVLLPDGSRAPIHHAKYSALDIASAISKSLAKRSVAARVNGQLWDLTRPLVDAVTADNSDINLELVDADGEDGRYVLAHSAAHVLGLALEREYGEDAMLADGPPVNNGRGGEFFYEGFLPGGATVHEGDLDRLTQQAQRIVKESAVFERVEVSLETAQEVFQHNAFKLHYLSRLPVGAAITLYRLADFVDLCLGPHLPNSGLIRAIEAHKVSGAVFPGDQGTPLQRVYGVAFSSAAQLNEWKVRRAAALERDHRTIGARQQLFMLHRHSPGSPFFLPHGMRIINTLTDMIRNDYWARGYAEVGSPSVYNKDLWKTSGHWDMYKDDMYMVSPGADSVTAGTEPEMGLKPMNCPGHCLMFAHTTYSYRELPVRFADFSALHRNEKAGALSGLTRVRKFHQDDAHIFCRRDQIEAEVASCLGMVETIYERFGMPVTYALSTRPDEYIGEESVWDEAEESLKQCLSKTGRAFVIHDKDGAFYGPKIDITVTDALGREHQTATIQLDFNLPSRFRLSYTDERGEACTPVMIHRAMLGSLERMFALLIEHTAGKWPVWLSPRQALVVPVSNSESLNEYAMDVGNVLKAGRLYADTDTSHETLKKKIRRGWEQQYNYMLIVGDSERDTRSVSVRTRGTTTSELMSLDAFADRLSNEARLPLGTGPVVPATGPGVSAP